MGVSRVRIAAEVGLTIALAAVLQMVAVWQLPQGGSYSLTMTPLFVLAILRGPRIGIVAGCLYGLVDFLIKPYPPLHPAQFILDYPLAYGLVGLAGITALGWRTASDDGRGVKAFWMYALPGIALGAIARYAAHVLSGLVFFASYAIEAGQAPLIYSLVYNVFVLVSAAACAAVCAAVLPQLHHLVLRSAR